jgi:hypothetical protein
MTASRARRSTVVSTVCGSYFKVPRIQRGYRGNVVVARPTSDGEAIRDLDQVPVPIGEHVLVIAHRRPVLETSASMSYGCETPMP